MSESAIPLVSERRHAILDLLRQEGRVLSGELARVLGTSEDTIRRDLREMSAEGLLRRVHGGALPCAPGVSPLAARLDQQGPEKQAIARAAATLLRDGQTAILDAGSSGVALARLLRPDLRATIFTNSLAAALELQSHPSIEVILLGGVLDKDAGSTWGAAALDALSRLQADICFLGVCGLDPEVGFTSNRHEEAAVKRRMVERSASAVALATADKLGSAGPHVVVPAADLTRVVTGPDAPQRLVSRFEDLGIEVLFAD